jgi:hypothetical protein
VQLCREQLGVHPCDKRRPLAHYRERYPAVDFDSHVRHEHDELWAADQRESVDDIRARAISFLQWLSARCEPYPWELTPLPLKLLDTAASPLMPALRVWTHGLRRWLLARAGRRRRWRW